MPSLRALNLLLVLLVLVPAGVLAWIGLRGASRLERDVEERLAAELRAAADDLRRVAAEVVAEDARAAQACVERLATAAARRLPLEPSGRVLRDLRALAGGDPAWGRDAPQRSLFAPVWSEVGIDVRVAEARGRPVLPPLLDPDAPATSLPERLVADLRGQAEALAFGRGDVAAGLRVWDEALPRLSAVGLGPRAAVERALLATARGPEPAAVDAEVQALLARHGRESLWAVGRPWVLLLLRRPPWTLKDEGPDLGRYRADPPALHALRELEAASRLDEIPLTEAERAMVNDRTIMRRLFGSAPLPAGRGEDLRRAPLPEGLVLELRRRMDVSFGPHEVLSTRFLRSQPQPLQVDLEFADAPGGERAAAATREQVEVPLIGGSRALARLVHLREESLRAEAQTQRRMTTLGAASLLAVLALGLLLTRRAVTREQAARRLQDDFLANVSHELRTPLTSVCLHADLLAEPDLPAQQQRAHAEVVRAEGARLSGLVEDLLDFAALGRGGRALEPEPVNLSRAVAQAVAPYRVLAQREGVALATEGDDGERLALADPHALGRILANLLGNAWKHGRPSRDGAPGRLLVRLRPEAAGPTLDMVDDGPGIPEAERAHLFERFRRGAGAARTRGVGLGLALSRDLARAMGGDLAVVPEAGRTVFRLTLPPVPAPPPESVEVLA